MSIIVLMIGVHAAHEGSSVMMVMGPVSLALANSELDPDPAVAVRPLPASLSLPRPLSEIATTAVMAMTAIRAIPPSTHFDAPPFPGDGGGLPAHCC
ncbi:hypothetical protein H8Z60_01535 [Mycolicibacterium fortuitum]|nr:hypothetical protein [Mycolicibacterium fortuitum]